MHHTLNRDLFFVDLISKFSEGSAPIEACISALTSAENRHGLELIAPGLDYQLAEPLTSGDPSRITIATGRWTTAVDPDDPTLDRLISQSLFPFLTETNAVLLCRHPDSSDIIFGGQFFFHATARAYAQTHATWAREVKWLNKADWTYLDLYYAARITDDFEKWIEALRLVVTEKTRRAVQA